MKISDTTIYLTDNGRAYCGSHLGATARSTGRDISGQPIIPVTPDVMAENLAMGNPPIQCETCGQQASHERRGS